MTLSGSRRRDITFQDWAEKLPVAIGAIPRNRDQRTDSLRRFRLGPNNEKPRKSFDFRGYYFQQRIRFWRISYFAVAFLPFSLW